MLETELRELFERQASVDQPPAAVTDRQVIRQGRSRLRVRRAGAVAVPLLAAAVAATVVAVALPGALPGKPHHHRPIPPAVPAAPKYFDPAGLYPSFGWLPADAQLTSGQTGTVSQYLSAEELNAGTPVGLAWMLTVHAGGQCSIAGAVLRCKGGSALSERPLTTQLPDINGLPAYWTVGQDGGTVVFEYARDGWAELTEYTPGGPAGLTVRDQAETVKVAEHATIGSSVASLVFPVQLTGLPGWQLRSAFLTPAQQGTPLAAGMLVYARGAAVDAPGSGILDNYPVLMVTTAGSGGNCYSGSGPLPPTFTAAQSTRSVIAGYPVTITRGTAASLPSIRSRDGHGSAIQQLCSADTGGLTIAITVRGNQPAIDVTQLFAHLRLLGPDPAHWTTKPVA